MTGSGEPAAACLVCAGAASTIRGTGDDDDDDVLFPFPDPLPEEMPWPPWLMAAEVGVGAVVESGGVVGVRVEGPDPDEAEGPASFAGPEPGELGAEGAGLKPVDGAAVVVVAGDAGETLVASTTPGENDGGVPAPKVHASTLPAGGS